MSETIECPKCGAVQGATDQTCQKCGEPRPYRHDQTGVACCVCDATITAWTVVCPECGETGYPALRPRTGKGFKGSPESEQRRAD